MGEETRKILEKILLLLNELKREIEELKEVKNYDFGEMINRIMRNVSEIVENEVNKAIGIVKKSADSRVIFYPFKKGGIFFDLESILPFSKKGKIEREIDKTLKDIEEEVEVKKPSKISHDTMRADLFEELIDRLNPSEVAETLSVLSNPDRLTILKLLYERDRYFSELEDILEIGPSSLRHHLSRLIDAGLVMQERSRGKYIITKRGIAALILASYLHRRILKFGEDSEDGGL